MANRTVLLIAEGQTIDGYGALALTKKLAKKGIDVVIKLHVSKRYDTPILSNKHL